jgi:hypothetical protein
MKKMLYANGILLVVAACVLAIALKTSHDKSKLSAGAEREKFEQTVADLYERIHQAEGQRDSARQKITELQDEVAALAERRSGDKRVIEDLWSMLVAATGRERKAEEKGPEAAVPSDGKREVPSDGHIRKTKYDAEAVKKMLASLGGNLDAAVHQMVTTEGIDRVLQDHADQPAYWTAAASLASDPNAARAYLEGAAQLYPDSAGVLSALLSAQMAAGTIDESVLARAAELQRADPTNALGDCYAAYCQFETGDVLGALQSLAQASAKGRFADDRIAMLTARYDYFLNEGASDAVALGMGAFTLPLEHLGMLRQVGQQAVEQVHSLSVAGQFDEALKIAQDVSTLGRTVSSSGRFLVHDRVGIAMEQAGLTEQRQIYEAQGDLRQVQTIDTKLQTLQDRSATIDTMAQAFGAVMGSMTDEDLAAYVDSTILNGEFTTLQNLPEIAEALKQARETPPEQPAQTPIP